MAAQRLARAWRPAVPRQRRNPRPAIHPVRAQNLPARLFSFPASVALVLRAQPRRRRLAQPWVLPPPALALAEVERPRASELGAGEVAVVPPPSVPEPHQLQTRRLCLAAALPRPQPGPVRRLIFLVSQEVAAHWNCSRADC